jgi:hypothetical protein
MLHIALHFIIPAVVARIGYRDRWRSAYLIMMATMVVDLDHLLADPFYDPNRCSIGFHPLHGLVPIAIYIALCAVPKLRIVGIGLVIHMLLDGLDCAVM